MMQEGIILRRQDYKENSKILYILTSDGIKSVFARGSKKPTSIFRLNTTPYTLIKYETTNGKFETLVQVDVINDYKIIKEDLEKNLFAANISLLVTHFFDVDEKIKLYDFFKKCLFFLEKNDSEIISFIFELKFLYFIGFAPNFKYCALCNQNIGIKGFNLKLGSIVCKNHLNYDDYDLKITLAIMKLYYINLDTDEVPSYDKSTKLAIRKFINDYYLYHANYVSKLVK